MGQVALTFRVMPETPEVNIEDLVAHIKTQLPKGAKWNAHTTRPFAFGLKAIECQIIVEDDAGGPDAVETALQGIENVQGVELIDMGRLL